MKKFFCAAVAVLAFGFASAIEVNRAEIESAGSSVEFENYGGPHAVIESARAITEIGGALGRLVSQNPQTQETFGEGAKYTLVHEVSEDEEGKLDADILILSKNAGVDHITNLRRILTGFLTEAYGYEEEDARAISVFVTVYNAVYRGNIEQFRDKYKENVLSHLDEKIVGLSTDWSEWAGNTQIVIPLGDLNGVSAVETSVISDENVVNALRESEGKGIEEREKLAEIKEKEGESAAKKASDAQKEAAEKKPAATEAKKEARQNPTEEKKAAAQKAQKEVEDAQKRSAEQQQIADRKKEEARSERESILRDARTPSVQDELAKESFVNGLIRTDEKSNFYGLVKVDSETGKIIRTSSVKNIRGRTLFTVQNIKVKTESSEESFDSMYLAVCGTNDGKNSAVKLCLIDSLTLEMKKESAETLAEDSALIQQGSDFFAIVFIDGDYYVGNYDQNLNLKRRSSVAVKASTPLSVTGKGIMATSKSGSPIILKTSDLASVWGENPNIDAK